MASGNSQQAAFHALISLEHPLIILPQATTEMEKMSWQAVCRSNQIQKSQSAFISGMCRAFTGLCVIEGHGGVFACRERCMQPLSKNPIYPYSSVLEYY